jgi:hypothetical protein
MFRILLFIHLPVDEANGSTMIVFALVRLHHRQKKLKVRHHYSRDRGGTPQNTFASELTSRSRRNQRC